MGMGRIVTAVALALGLALDLAPGLAPAMAQSVSLVPTWESPRLARDPGGVAADYPDDPLPATMVAMADLREGRFTEAASHARDAVAKADRLSRLAPGVPIAVTRSFGALRAAEWAGLAQGDLASARADANRMAAELPGISLTHAEVMRTAYLSGDVDAADKASARRDRAVASMPPGLPDALTTPVPGTWAMPAQIRMASGDPAGALARLVEGGADRAPASTMDRVDALFVEGIATLENGTDDRYALATLRKPAALDPTPRNRLWAAAAAMLSGSRPPPELLVETSPLAYDLVVRLFAGIATETSVREGLSRAWGEERGRASGTSAWQADRVERAVARERCETDFLIAVHRGFHGARDWVDDVARTAGSCPRTAEAGWAARAVASRWRVAR